MDQRTRDHIFTLTSIKLAIHVPVGWLRLLMVFYSWRQDGYSYWDVVHKLMFKTILYFFALHQQEYLWLWKSNPINQCPYELNTWNTIHQGRSIIVSDFNKTVRLLTFQSFLVMILNFVFVILFFISIRTF